MRRGVRLVHHTDIRVASTLTLQVTSRLATVTGNRPSLHGSRLKRSNKQGKVVAKPQCSPRSRLRVQSRVNDNHCVNYVTGQKNSVFVTGQVGLNPTPVVAGNSKVTLDLNVNFLCCKCSYCHRVATKERRKSQCLSNVHRNKICERCFLCRSLEFYKSCYQCPTCCYRSSCRGKVTPVLGEMGSSGFESKSSHHTEGGLHPPLPVQTQLDKVTNSNKQLPQLSQAVLPLRGTVSADKQECSRTGRKSKLTGFLQPAIFGLQLAIFGTQTQQPVETGPGPDHLEHLFKHRVVQNGDPRDNNLLTGRGVGHIHRLQRRIIPYTNSQSVQEVHAFSPPGSVLPVQSSTLWSIHSSHGVHSGVQRGQTHGTSEGYKDPPVPRRLAGESLYPQHLSPAYTDLNNPLSRTRVLVNKEKSELVPKQVFNFVGYQFDLKEGRVKPTPERWQTLIDKIQSILSGPVCPVWQFMSLIGLLTATEKQVHLGRLHMRPIQ